MQSLINEVQAAEILGVSVPTLQRDRCVNGDTPRFPYVKIGRSVRYDHDVLRRVIDAARVGDAPRTAA